ncbi:RNA-binding S4 domain-containing protein [Roseicyclus sp. F158]|uniref:RNA-binding S4 domain-containing protein n=1 Tax=Tropicimonas omnivorans TaxID=3075590 RepID=A0ABU3DFK6_9RHOB|nr:RNA-binding S4 domain-containing protein [Roseicyclus sp. F158]MDT0681912.1 RNA-binding S4 domain-containing protein [Roseicyclus sp. F158]
MTDTPLIRVDKWLWHARFFKSRGLSAKAVSDGGIRVDGVRISKPSRSVGPGNTLTFVTGNRVRVVRIVDVGTRRGPAPEAQALYEDLSPPPEPRDDGAPVRTGPRPTKKDRRRMDATRSGALDPFAGSE